jgi:DNA polymerase-1
MEFLAKQKALVRDTETDGLHSWHGARLIGVSVAPPDPVRKHCYYFPFRHEQGGNLSKQQLRMLMKLLSEKLGIYWNAKFDVQMLCQEGMQEPDPRRVRDMMLLLHLLNENENKTGGSYELKPSAARYLDEDAMRAELKLKMLLADRGLTKGDMKKLKPSEVDEYASDDVYYTGGFHEMMMPKADEWDLLSLFKEINNYVLVTRRMENWGIPINPRKVRTLIKTADERATKLRRKMERMAGNPNLNPGSPKQMQRWLELPSTAAKYIDEIAWQLTGDQRKAVRTMQEFRAVEKSIGSYYKPMLTSMDADEICHPNIVLHGTISGRPSTKGSPNWFAIPRQTDDEFDAYHIKDAVEARDGYEFIQFDYAQAELRLGAHYSGDEFNIQCFREGKSPHRLLHAQLTEADVKISYDDTKRVSFGVMYGTGPKTLSKELKKSIEFARMVLKEAHRLHPNYRPMLDQTTELAKDLGYIRLWTGRVRHFNSLAQPEWWYHKACSNLIQGGIAEVLRHAICRVDEKYVNSKYDVHQNLQVYDSLLLEVPKGEAKRLAPGIRHEMIRDFPFDVPMEVDCKIGQKWGELQEHKIT